MRRIAKGTEIGVVGSDNEDPAGRPNDAMELLHRADHVREMLDDVNGPKRLEGIIAERIRESIEVADDIGARARIPIDSDSAGVFVDAAADVESCGTGISAYVA